MDASALDPRLRPPPDAAAAAPPHPASLTPADSPLTPAAVGRPSAHPGAHPAAALSPTSPTSATPSSAVHPATPGQGGGGGGASSPSAGDGAPGAGDAADPKKPRACEACRGLKVRCDPNPADPEGACKRCAKAGRACLVTQPTRKRQKKTDSRVAELEKKIDALTATLQSSHGHPVAQEGHQAPPPPPLPPLPPPHHAEYGRPMPSQNRNWVATPAREMRQTESPYEREARLSVSGPTYPAPMVMAGQKRKFTETRDVTEREAPREAPPAAAAAVGGRLTREYSDIVDRGLITMDKAIELFQRYTDRMCQHLPAVVFSEGTTAAEVRKSKPVLFLAVMAAASAEIPATQRVLVKEMMQMFAEKIVVVGEKSLELVQALHVSVIWYWPPEHFEELKFYQLVHMAAVMALDIGLGRRRPGRNRRHIPYTWRDHPFKKHPPPDPASLEARRTWLTCYFLTTNTAMALHRPNLLRWTSFMAECVDMLETSPEAAPTDKYLCHLVWTHRMAEDVGVQFAMDDPSAVINITDPRTQYALKNFERDLDKYRSSLSKDMLQPSLLLSFQVVSLYMHEIALQTENSHDDFRPPFTADSMKEAVIGEASLTPAHINALSACLTAIDGIFGAFVDMEVAAIRCLPVFNFVRVAYATVVLIKLYFAASSPGSELGKVINKDQMKVESHLEALVDRFRATAADDKSRPAAKFLVVLVMIRSWFQKQGQRNRDCGKPCHGVTAPPGASSCPSAAAAPYADKSPVQPPLQHQQQQQHQPYPMANNPLHLLSEIAANDSAASRAPAPSSSLPPMPWFQGSHPQPFIYDAVRSATATSDRPTPNGPPTPNSTAPSGPDAYLGPSPTAGLHALGAAAAADESASASAAATAGGYALNNAQEQEQAQQQQQQLWADAFDYVQLGDGFAQAMDLTLAGFGDGDFGTAAGDGLSRFLSSEPWFSDPVAPMSGGGAGGYPF